MKFVKIIFWIATVWGFFMLTPLFFMFDIIGRRDPPPITHPGFYYGFLSVGLAWQFVFPFIARDPIRFRPIMLPSMLEKFGYAGSLTLLYFQHRLHAADLVFAGIDGLLGALFLLAFLKTPATLS